MKRFITTCMLLAAVICYGLEIHTPTKKEKEIIAAQVSVVVLYLVQLGWALERFFANPGM